MQWGEFDTEIRKVGGKLAASGWSPDAVVGIVRGGVVPAMMLANLSNVRKLYLIKVSHVGDERRVKRFEPDVFEKKVLLVEDMLETGKSLKAAKEFLEGKGAEVRTAALYAMKGSVIKPDFYLREVPKVVEFPWE
jgi:hypoxanthine phosphoribosyltransferase